MDISMDISTKDMTANSYLIFRKHAAFLAINALLVKEIIALPEITWIAEAPPCIKGAINLRGTVIPVLDLDICFSLSPQRYQLTDAVIVLGEKDAQMGILVNEVQDLISIPPQDLAPAAFHNRERYLHPHLVKGSAKAGENLIMVLDPDKLLDFDAHVPETRNSLADDNTEEEALVDAAKTIEPVEPDYFCPEAIPLEKALFHERAMALMQPPVSEDFAGMIPMALVGMNREYFGVDIECVREFSDIKNLTPIPCTPDYILGSMNFRGNVMTLIDLRTLLNMQFTGLSPSTQIVVASVEGALAGVAVDVVFDVIYLNPADIVPVPVAVKTVSEKFIRGTAFYGDKTLAILDLKKILKNDAFIVNEQV
ncbi:MAG: chemotaxis protein CheW [Desulfobacteraceae bacterium]|nr:MAG: chemotaxis protein CheW [Desulfobacteraceae bacterium]